MCSIEHCFSKCFLKTYSNFEKLHKSSSQKAIFCEEKKIIIIDGLQFFGRWRVLSESGKITRQEFWLLVVLHW